MSWMLWGDVSLHLNSAETNLHDVCLQKPKLRLVSKFCLMHFKVCKNKLWPQSRTSNLSFFLRQTKSFWNVSCVSLRAVQRSDDVLSPLRVSWGSWSAHVCSCWMTCRARELQLRWTQLWSAWGVSRSTSEPCPPSSSKGRCDANLVNDGNYLQVKEH